MMESASLNRLVPVAVGERIASIDVARGVALLGILFVNIHYMAEPAGIYFEGVPPANSSAVSRLAWYFYHTFCEGKFYPLFSMLFGAGLAIQFERAKVRGSGWWLAPIRRLLTLLFIGIAHALLVWYGDILVTYAILGFLMIVLVRLPLKGLAAAGGVLVMLALAMLALGVIATAMGGHFSGRKPETDFVLDSRPPFEQLITGLRDQSITGPWDSGWRVLETQAMRDGPYSQAFGVRAVTWLMTMFFTLFGGGAIILLMFIIGAILVKTDFFNQQNRVWHRRIALGGLAIGIPSAIGAAFAAPYQTVPWGAAAYGVAQSFGGPILSLGYLGSIVLWANSGRASALARVFSNAGRMGLTSYLLCSILGTALFYHWGLQWFGQTTVAQRLLLAIGVYATVAAFASLWLRSFLFGPMECFWRSMTYLRFPPMVRRESEAATTLAS